MKNKWIYALLIVCLLMVSAPAVSAKKQLKVVDSIHMPESDQIQPSIFEDTLVFVDDEHSNPNIFIYDLKTRNRKQIVSDPNTPKHPHIQGSKVVWEDFTVTNWDIFLYYPDLNEDVQITHNYANQTNPFVFGNYIAWQDDRNGNWDIFLYDMETAEERQITNSTADQVSPKMTRMSVEIELVWLDKGKDGEDSEICELRLRAFNESLDNIRQITNDTSDQAHIAASLDNVVFSCDEGGSYNIYINDWEIELTNQITFDDVDQKYPAFDLDNIVWIDDRTGHDEVYQFGLIFQEQFQLTDSRNPKSDVQINHNWVVWVEDSGGDKEIYYLDLNVNAQENKESFNPQYIIGFFLIFGAVYLLVVTFKKPKAGQMPTAADINSLRTRDELTGMCSRLGLSTKGNKRRLRKRLMVYVDGLQKTDSSESVGGKKMKLRPKKHYSRAHRKSTEPAQEEPDEIGEFDFDAEEIIIETEKHEGEIGRMDEALNEVKDGLEGQRRELEMLRRDLVDLDIRVAGKKQESGRPEALEWKQTSKDDKEGILKVLEGLLEHSPENISIKISLSENYVMYIKVVNKKLIKLNSEK